VSIVTDGIRHRHVLTPQENNSCDLCAVEASVWEEVRDLARRYADEANVDVVKRDPAHPARGFYLGQRNMADVIEGIASENILLVRERKLW